MPFALLIAGAVVLVAGVRHQEQDLFDLLEGDLTGKGNYLYWCMSILAVGADGYVRPLKPVSDAFLALLIIVLLLVRGNPKKNPNGGFFAQFEAALNTKPQTETGSSAASNTSGTAKDFGAQLQQISQRLNSSSTGASPATNLGGYV